jgi:glycosyltransferase involved in cell wall biosynthesis
MRILIVHREYPPETGWGGIATFNYHLAKGLMAIGHEVDVLSFNYGAPSDRVVEDVRVKRITSKMKRLPWEGSLGTYFWSYQRQIGKIFLAMHRERKYDVVDCADHLGEGYSIIRSGRVATTLRFFSPWSWVSSQKLNLSERWYDIALIKWIEKRSAQGAHHLTCPSQDLATRVTEFFGLRRPIEIIPNPIDIQRFAPQDELPDSPVRVLFAGRLEPRKGPDILLKAIPLLCRKVPDIRFTFLGADCPTPTSPSFKAEAELFISRNHLDQCVAFKDPVPLISLPKEYNAVHIVVVPSRYDTSPYVCQEAMACGRAVVGTTSGGMPEYLDQGEAGLLIPPEDPAALADAIVRLAQQPQLRRQLGVAARRRVEQLYDRNAIARRTSALYETAIQNWHRGIAG